MPEPSRSTALKILFISRHYSYLRLFESAIEGLAAHGHHVVLAADREEAMGGRQMVDRIAARYPNVMLADVPNRRSGAWSELARRLRLGIDYFRFLDPRYARTIHFLKRAQDRAPRIVVRLANSRLGSWLGGPAGLLRMLRFLERGIPGARAIEGFISAQAPDVLLITPLVDIGSPQLDHLAAAQRLGVRTVLPVASWDHLSSKSLLRTVPSASFSGTRGSARKRSRCTACPPIGSSSRVRSVTTSGSTGRRRWVIRRSATAWV